MIIVLIVTTLCSISWGAYAADKWKYDWLFYRIISSAILGFVLLFLIICRTESQSFIRKYSATKETIANSNIGTIENAALVQKVVEVNQQIAASKYWAGNYWTNWFYDSDILNLEPLKIPKP